MAAAEASSVSFWPLAYFVHLEFGGAAQRVIDARLPARPGRAEICQHIRIDPQLDRFLRIFGQRPSAADQLIPAVHIGALEIVPRQLPPLLSHPLPPPPAPL